MGFDMSEVDRLAADLGAAPAKVDAAGARVVATTTQAAEHDAVEFAPKRTGFLADNIVSESHGLRGSVVSLADYSKFVEDGTSDTAPQPFIRPAAERAHPRLADGAGDAGQDIL